MDVLNQTEVIYISYKRRPQVGLPGLEKQFTALPCPRLLPELFTTNFSVCISSANVPCDSHAIWGSGYYVQLLFSCIQLFATPWTAACQASLSFTNSPSLHKLMSIKSVMPFNHLILCQPLLLLPSIFPSISFFSNVLALCIRRPEYWSFSFSISISNEYSGLISFRIDWFDSLQLKGPLRVFSSTTIMSIFLAKMYHFKKNIFKNPI